MTLEEKEIKLQKNREACARWREKNREYERLRALKYYQDNPEKRRDSARNAYLRNKNYFKEWAKNNPRDKRLSMLYSAQDRAKKMGIDFSIDLDDIVIPEVCPILNIPLAFGKGRPVDGSPSLDRVNNALGYVKGNVRVISHKANRLKSDMSFEDISRLFAYIQS